MGVDFRGVQMVVAQHLLDGPDVHAVLQHQRGGGVPQLVGAVLRRVDARLTQPLFHHGVDRGAADPLVLGGEEEGVCAARPVMGRRTARYLAMASWQASFR